MLYRETGVFRTSYGKDQAIFRIPLDRYAVVGWLILAFLVVPLAASNYVLTELLTPFLIMSIAALGRYGMSVERCRTLHSYLQAGTSDR